MNTISQPITRRIPLDRPWWLALRCTVGWCLMARWELKDFTLTVKEGRKPVNYTVWFNVREAVCCGKSEMERVV